MGDSQVAEGCDEGCEEGFEISGGNDTKPGGPSWKARKKAQVVERAAKAAMKRAKKLGLKVVSEHAVKSSQQRATKLAAKVASMRVEAAALKHKALMKKKHEKLVLKHAKSKGKKKGKKKSKKKGKKKK